MIRLLNALARYFQARERRRIAELERQHAADLDAMKIVCERAISDLYCDFQNRLALTHGRFVTIRRVGMVEASDRGLYVHPNGEESEFGEQVGSC